MLVIFATYFNLFYFLLLKPKDVLKTYFTEFKNEFILSTTGINCHKAVKSVIHQISFGKHESVLNDALFLFLRDLSGNMIQEVHERTFTHVEDLDIL